MSFLADSFRSQVSASDQEVAAYFDAHPADFKIPEKRKIRYLIVDIDALRAKVTVPPADIERAYNDNLEQYSTPEQVRASHILFSTEGKDDAAVKAKAEDVLKQARAGADFGALAKKYSEDEASAKNGGDLDYLDARPHGSRIRSGGVHAAGRPDQRRRQDAVRLRHHQGDRQEARHHAHARRGAAAADRPARRTSAPRRRPATWRRASRS